MKKSLPDSGVTHSDKILNDVSPDKSLLGRIAALPTDSIVVATDAGIAHDGMVVASTTPLLMGPEVHLDDEPSKPKK